MTEALPKCRSIVSCTVASVAGSRLAVTSSCSQSHVSTRWRRLSNRPAYHEDDLRFPQYSAGQTEQLQLADRQVAAKLGDLKVQALGRLLKHGQPDLLQGLFWVGDWVWA